MTSVLRRMFSTKRRSNIDRLANSLAGIRNRLKLVEEDGSNNYEELDPHDISEFESDFMNISESQKMHERYMLYIYIIYISHYNMYFI